MGWKTAHGDPSGRAFLSKVRVSHGEEAISLGGSSRTMAGQEGLWSMDVLFGCKSQCSPIAVSCESSSKHFARARGVLGISKHGKHPHYCAAGLIPELQEGPHTWKLVPATLFTY